MTVNREDGQFQASYWQNAEAVGGEPDEIEYSDFQMELKQRIDQALRRRQYAYAAIFHWNGADWDLVEEFERRAG